MLCAVTIPKPNGNFLQHFEKVGLRNAMACAVASLAALIRISPSGSIEAAHLAWGSVGPTVIRLPDIEAALVGHSFEPATLEAVIPSLRERLAPIDDVRASAAYRRQVAGNLLLRLTAGPFSVHESMEAQA
jgi:CO/xanthine dehydrogenase FAD-binding subunit